MNERTTNNMWQNIKKHIWAVAVTAILFTGCASKKVIEQTTTTSQENKPKVDKPTTETNTPDNTRLIQATYIKRVIQNRVDAANITADMSIRIQTEDKDITMPGAIKMRNNKVIRLQIFVPILGTEVARVDFMPSKVLVIDRIHKQYVEAGYDDLDFLKRNGLDFYTLQAFFRNQLALPGKQLVTEDMTDNFTLEKTSATQNDIKFQRGNIAVTWQTEPQKAQIKEAQMLYKAGNGKTSTLQWIYNDFKNIGLQSFPAQQTIRFETQTTAKVKQASLFIQMEELGSKSSWEETTTVSSKYKKLEATDLLNKILNL